jgi:hypothetical protein
VIWNKALIGQTFQRALDGERRKRKSGDGGWKEMSVLCICLAERKLLSSEDIMMAFVCWKVRVSFVFKFLPVAGRKQETGFPGAQQFIAPQY